MTSPVCACIICGDSIATVRRHTTASFGELSWKSEFRVCKNLLSASTRTVLCNQSANMHRWAEVLSGPPNGSEPRLSGVGIDADFNDHDYNYRVPLSYFARWDDQGRCLSDMRKVPSAQLGDIFDDRECALHARCCSLLEEFFYPRPVPIARLYEVCRSCPRQGDIQGDIMNLGHDYQGGVKLWRQYPWDEVDINSSKSVLSGDPLEIPELAKILSIARMHKPNKTNINSKWIHETVANCFTKLPREILGYIMIYLPTDDIKALSGTCKELKRYIPSELEPSFWFSRFQAPFEFDYIFEVHKYNGKQNWETLYFEVAKAMKKSEDLECRAYIWDYIRFPLSDLLSIRMDSDRTLRLPNKDKLRWKEVCGDFRQRSGRYPPLSFDRGCNRFYTQRTSIPTFCQVIVSAIFIGNISYITGLCFISNTGLEIRLGYKAREERPLQGIKHQVINTSGIQGFIVALGSKGIQALRVIFGFGQLSPWFGHSSGLLKTRRLASFNHIAALEAGFDVRLLFVFLGVFLYYLYYIVLISYLGI
jgi:hypothetical protein